MITMQRCLLIFVFLLISTIAFGEPFLVSDPYPDKGNKPAKFLITINGETHESMPMNTPEGSVYLKYDLVNLSDGTYTAAAKAVDAKGVESSAVTYSFTKTGTKVEPYVSDPVFIDCWFAFIDNLLKDPGETLAIFFRDKSSQIVSPRNLLFGILEDIQ